MGIGEYLKSHCLLTDGAMGTYYAEIKRQESPVSEWANIREPEVVADCKSRNCATYGKNWKKMFSCGRYRTAQGGFCKWGCGGCWGGVPRACRSVFGGGCGCALV